jgi:maleylpyruvate isomerase
MPQYLPSQRMSSWVTPPLPELMAWLAAGEELLTSAIGELSDNDFAARSRLDGWTNAHIVGHVGLNADALRNLLSWARTGVETPMYASTDQRTADIEAASRLPVAALRSEYATSSSRLLTDIDTIPVEAWDSVVQTANGRNVQASYVPWMRIRESWIHSIDLAAEPTFDVMPQPIVNALLTEVCQLMAARSQCPRVAIVASDLHAEREMGSGGAFTLVQAPARDLLAWLAGRDISGVSASWPVMPAWL